MIRGSLTVGGPLIFRRVTDYDWLGSPDSYRGPVLLAGPDGQRETDCPDVLFCRFPHIFRDFCEGFGCFRREFWPSRAFDPRGPENPKGGGGAHTLSAPLGYVPDFVQRTQPIHNIFLHITQGKMAC